MYYNYPSIFFSSISLDMKKPGFVKKNNQCSTLQCKSCLKYERKKTLNTIPRWWRVFFFFTKYKSLYPTIILLYYIYSTYQRTLQFLFLTNLFPSSFVSSLTRFLLFFFLGKWSQKYFSRKKIILKILLKFRLFKEFKLIHITLLCSTIPLLPLYFC